MSIRGSFKDRAVASGVHLLISMLVAMAAALLVFGFWYPHPFREVSGGWALFAILVSVDVVVGPLLTGVVFDRRKPRGELKRDVSIIVALQIAALVYGLWSMYQARPVYLVYEVDRFVALSAADIDPSDLEGASPDFRALPRSGVKVIGLRDFRDSDERANALDFALAGKDLSLQPRFWQVLSEANRQEILRKARPLSELQARSDADRRIVDEWLAGQVQGGETWVYVPLVARDTYWTAVVDRHSANIKGYLPIDAF